MGILQDKVDEAYLKLKEGDFEGFVLGIADVADVKWQNHKDIVLERIEKNNENIRIEVK